MGQPVIVSTCLGVFNRCGELTGQRSSICLVLKRATMAIVVVTPECGIEFTEVAIISDSNRSEHPGDRINPAVEQDL
jgi:hypothetical protein